MPSAQSQPDLLFFFSDQHHGLYSGYAGHAIVQTPNLDRIAANGTACETAYTPCPLCVPARGALLTGQLPSHTGVFNNNCIIPSDQSTFLHTIAAQGYETVFCGRMHFKGPDQRHGFTKRIAPDITTMWNSGLDGGSFYGGAFGMGGCANFAAAGTSPVLDYDRLVVGAALDYLHQDHDKPQCIVVGTYGPHFPYVAPPSFFDLYHGRTDTPASWEPEGVDPNPMVDAKRQRTRTSPVTGETTPLTEEDLHARRAAYFGMITEQDRHVGAVRDAWQDYLQRNGREGVFVYSSDHGDTCGEHGIFGKQTFYEGSVRIPMLFEGAGIQAGKRLSAPASLLDIGPTLCDLVGAQPPPAQDGVSLLNALTDQHDEPADRAILSEWTQGYEGQTVAARMVRRGHWKLMHYAHPNMPDQLFDLETDPDELHNRADECPDILQDLRAHIDENWDAERVAAWADEKRRHATLLRRWTEATHPPSPETEIWRIPEPSKQPPERVF